MSLALICGNSAALGEAPPERVRDCTGGSGATGGGKGARTAGG